MLSALFSWLHILAFGIGLASVYARGRALGRGDVPALLQADNAWGIAAVLWIGSGLTRAFGGLEKGTDWYLHSPWFALKMGLFGVVFLLELLPMVTFMRWRLGRAVPDPARFALLGRINRVELVLLVVLALVAALMSRNV